MHIDTCTHVHTHHTNITQTHTTYALDWLYSPNHQPGSVCEQEHITYFDAHYMTDYLAGYGKLVHINARTLTPPHTYICTHTTHHTHHMYTHHTPHNHTYHTHTHINIYTFWLVCNKYSMESLLSHSGLYKIRASSEWCRSHHHAGEQIHDYPEYACYSCGVSPAWELEVITAHYLFCCVALLSTIHVAYHSAPYFSSTSLCYITLLPTSLLHHSATFNWVRHSTLVRKYILSHTYP